MGIAMTSPRIRLDYGRHGLWVNFPPGTDPLILASQPVSELQHPDEAIRRALRCPMGAPPLADLARGRRDACIVICDITRPVPNRIILPPILEALESAGIPDERVQILIATGTHRPNTPAEIEEMVGREIAERYRVHNHRCTEAGEHCTLGHSPGGVPVALDRRYVEADLRITTGLIEPHFMAGWSGGRKLVMPGLAALPTVEAWHSPRYLEHPRATAGILEGNPVHEEALAIANMARPHFIVDVTLSDGNCITGVFAGDMEEAWRHGVAFAGRSCRVAIDHRVDVVVTTSAGHPLDATFYQAVKGITGALPIVKRGGTIIVAAACSEGIGSPHFARLLAEADDLAGFADRIQQPTWTFVPDQWQVEELARAASVARIVLVSEGIAPEDLRRIPVASAPSVEAAVAEALEVYGPGATIAVIPRGPYVIAELERHPSVSVE
ncbi:MAG: nickel-dependent lactate racemase [Chthonomonadales bacterium]